MLNVSCLDAVCVCVRWPVGRSISVVLCVYIFVPTIAVSYNISLAFNDSFIMFTLSTFQTCAQLMYSGDMKYCI